MHIFLCIALLLFLFLFLSPSIFLHLFLFLFLFLFRSTSPYTVYTAFFNGDCAPKFFEAQVMDNMAQLMELIRKLRSVEEELKGHVKKDGSVEEAMELVQLRMRELEVSTAQAKQASGHTCGHTSGHAGGRACVLSCRRYDHTIDCSMMRARD